MEVKRIYCFYFFDEDKFGNHSRSKFLLYRLDDENDESYINDEEFIENREKFQFWTYWFEFEIKDNMIVGMEVKKLV